MAFVNFGIIAWNKNDLWKLLLFFLLAFLFHNTSIIFITIFAVSIYISRALGNKIPFVLYGLIALIYFIPKEITVSGDHRLITKINHYFNYIYYTNPLKTIYLIGFYLLIILLITKVHKKINQQHLWKINYLLLSIAISLAFFKITSIRERIFYQLVIILMLFYFSAKKHLTKRHKIISKISLLFFACTMYVSNLKSLFARKQIKVEKN